MILAGRWRQPLPERPQNTDPAECGDCGDAIHGGNLCLECARDRRELAIARDAEWWQA